MIGEDEYFGLDKFNELHLQLPSNKEDNVQFINDTIKKTEDEIFKSDYYSDFIPFHKRPKLPKNELCGCSRKKYEQERALKAQQS